MKVTALLFLIVFSAACGSEKSNNSGSTVDAYGQKLGILSIPAPGVYGGGPSILYGNSNLQVANSSPAASNYLSMLDSGQVNIIPLRNTSVANQYRVRFVGSIGQGPCPINPMAVCSVVNLDSIQAY